MYYQQRQSMWKKGILICLFPLLAWASPPAMLKQVNISKATSSTTQLVFNFNAPATYKWFFLTNPRRLVVDFQLAQNHANLKQLMFSNTLVANVRTGGQGTNNLRVVLDLTHAAKLNIQPLAANTLYPFRLKLILTNSISPTATEAHTTASNTKTLSPTLSSAAISPKPVLSLPNQFPPRKMVVMIDPGHGGKDPGAIGPKGIHEKDLVLAISRNLYKLLQQEPGLTVYMTRNSDYYISLRQRLQIARQDKADIFIAIHADAYKEKDSTGASVYTLSMRGASSEAARWIAEKENYSELAGIDLNGKNDMLRSVLIDLSQTATISSSLWLGTNVLKQISTVSLLHKNKVEQAPFVVLKSPDIPSILIETGFISNPAEERALSSSAYQQKMAKAIMAGINEYFRQHPPTGNVPS